MMFAQLLAALTLTCLAAAPAQEPAEEPPFRNSVAELQITLATQPHDDVHLEMVERLLGHALKWTQTELAAGRVPTATLKGDLTTLFCLRADLSIELGVREDKRLGLVAPPVSLDPALVSVELTALLDELSTRPELVARAAALQQSGSASGIDWLDEVLEPWGATWIRAEFGVVDRDVYERVRTELERRSVGFVAERWEVAPLFVLLLQWDCSRVVVDVGPRPMEANLAALAQSAPEKLARFDGAFAQRRGAACDEWMLRALSSVSAQIVRVPSTLEALTPVLSRLLGRRDLDLWPSIRSVLSEMRSQRELPPQLVQAWATAVLAADGSRARALLEGFADLQVAVTDPYAAQWRGDQPWYKDLFRPLLTHEESDIQLFAATYFLKGNDPVLLDWATHTDVAHRSLALDVAAANSSNASTATSPARAALVGALDVFLVDPDPTLRERAITSLRRSWILESEWLHAALGSPSPEVRTSTAEWILERAAPRSEANPMARAQTQSIQPWLEEQPELCAAVLNSVDDKMRGRWTQIPWSTAELARRELLRLMTYPSASIASSVGWWLDQANSPPGAWFDVLAARVQLPEPLKLDEHRLSSRLEELDAHAEVLALATEARSSGLLVGVLNLRHHDHLRSMFAPLPPADRKWAMVRLWQETPGKRRDWLTILETAGDPALVRALVEDEELSVVLRASAAVLMPSRNEADDQLLMVLVAELAVSSETFSSIAAVEKFSLVDPNGSLVRWLSAVPFDPSVGLGARFTRERVYQWLAPGQPGVQEALVAVVEDLLAHRAGPSAWIGLEGPNPPAAAASIRNHVQARTASLVRTLLERYPSTDAIQLAAALGVPETVEGLANLVNGPPDTPVTSRVQAIEALRRFPDSEVAANALRMALLSPETTVVTAAAAALDTWSRYRAAGEANAAVPSEAQAIAELFALLDHAQPALRAEAARGLATLGAAAAIPRLIALLADPDPTVRTAARESLDRLHTRPLAPAPAKDAPAPAKEPAPPEDS